MLFAFIFVFGAAFREEQKTSTTHVLAVDTEDSFKMSFRSRSGFYQCRCQVNKPVPIHTANVGNEIHFRALGLDGKSFLPEASAARGGAVATLQ